MKSLFKTVSIITFFAIFSKILGFLFKVVLSRTITTEELGIFQIALSIFVVLLMLSSSGMQVVVSKLSSKFQAQNNQKAEHKMISCSLIISISLALICSLFVILFRNILENLLNNKECVDILYILLPSILFQSLYSVFRGFLWGHTKYFLVCISEIIEQTIKILLCVVLFAFHIIPINSVKGIAFIITIASFISCLFMTISYFVVGGRLLKPSNLYKQILKSNTVITGIRVVSSLAQPVIALILPLRLIACGYTQSQALSLFGIATGMTMPLLFIPITLVGSLSMALIPDLSKAQCENDNKHITNRISSSITFTILISFIFLPIFIGAGENIGLFLFNNVQSGIFLTQSAWLMIPFALTNISSSILNALSCEHKSLINYCVGAIFLLLSIILLPKYIGINSLIVGIGSCITITSLLNLRIIKKRTNTPIKIFKPILKMVLFTIPSASLTYFLTNIFEHFFPLFLNLVISCSLGILTFILQCVIFNVIDLSSIYIKYKQKINFKKKYNFK